jgi:hypothetical protein
LLAELVSLLELLSDVLPSDAPPPDDVLPEVPLSSVLPLALLESFPSAVWA